jgi:hypothetical protein
MQAFVALNIAMLDVYNISFGCRRPEFRLRFSGAQVLRCCTSLESR